MSSVFQVQGVWSGFNGEPGTSTFYSKIAEPSAEPFSDFIDSVGVGMPSSVLVTFGLEQRELDEQNGDLLGTWLFPNVETGNGSSGSGDYAGGVGVVVRWLTGAIHNGRRVYGHTFLVPTVGVIFDTVGGIDSGYQSTVLAAAQHLIDVTEGNLVVWHRPTPSDDGVAFPIVGATLPNKAAILRSRRD